MGGLTLVVDNVFFTTLGIRASSLYSFVMDQLPMTIPLTLPSSSIILGAVPAAATSCDIHEHQTGNIVEQ